MTKTDFHPATLQLLWLQSRGRRRRMWRRFCQPRRLILSAVACVLAVVWLGNAAMTVCLREAAAPESLRALLSLGLLFYAGWHFSKAAFFRSDGPFDWSPAERELLAAMPLRPRDLVAYQIASVTVTTMLKAALFTFLLLPDLRCPSIGVIGLLLALLSLELLRMSVDIATWGMCRTAYLLYRAVVIAGLMVGGFAVGAAVVRANAITRIELDEGLFDRLLDILIQVNSSLVGYAALPFQPLIDLILSLSITAGNLRLAAAALLTTAGLAAAVIGLYAWTARRVAHREKCNYRAESRARDSFESSTRKVRSTRSAKFQLRPSRLPHWGGAGALAWRQLLAARRQRGSLLTAMIAPAVLAVAPGLFIADPFFAVLCTTGTLAFYTFLLLPTALRFDFRRDLDHLATLKGLPITPAAAVLGQTLAPVLIATLFQIGVLAVVVIARTAPPHQLVVAMLVMVPLNVLVFGLDNLFYLLYPYRVQQEGLEIFLRTMLTFTGKGLLFTVGLVAMGGWGFIAAALARRISEWTGGGVNAYAVFTVGMIAGPSVLAALVLFGLCRSYLRMDPIEDIPR